MSYALQNEVAPELPSTMNDITGFRVLGSLNPKP